MWSTLKMLKTQLPYGSVTPLLGVHPRKQKKHLEQTPALGGLCDVVRGSHTWEQLRSCLSTETWNYRHTHHGLFTREKEGALAIWENR